MLHSNFSAVLVTIGILVSREVRGAMPDRTVLVRKLVALGLAAEMPACTESALGEDTISYDENERRALCDQMQSNCVIECVQNEFNHHPNTLSGEVPGDTKIFAVYEVGKNEMNDRHLVGFHCKADTAGGSKSFVVTLLQYSPGEFGYVAYVPREHVNDGIPAHLA